MSDQRAKFDKEKEIGVEITGNKLFNKVVGDGLKIYCFNAWNIFGKSFINNHK